MSRATRLLSISAHTTRLAAGYTPGLREATVVPLCTEPPDLALDAPYQAALRERAVLIVGNIYDGLMYKGHQQLIAAWPQVVAVCPEAQLWIVGRGDGARLLRGTSSNSSRTCCIRPVARACLA